MQAQHHRKLINQLAKIKGQVDMSAPGSYHQAQPVTGKHTHRKSKNKSFRQMEIDNENNVLLSKIVKIMARKNKSLHDARKVGVYPNK